MSKDCSNNENTLSVGTLPKPFEPIKETWQKQMKDKFKLEHSRSMDLDYLPIHQCYNGDQPTGVKCGVRVILGDGNCLFRSLSYILSGTEENYALIRREIVKSIKKYEETDKQLFNNQTPQEYLTVSKMENDGTWGTEVEIGLAAFLFKVNIYTLTETNSERVWQHSKPSVFDMNGSLEEDEKYPSVFLYNENGNHYDVILPSGNNKMNQQEIYNCAIGLFGSEEHVAIRRQLILFAERITNHYLPQDELIEGGSFAEGICYPQSDIDQMICKKSQHIIQDFSTGFNAGDLLIIPTSPCYCLLIDITHTIPQSNVCTIFGLRAYSSTLLKENKRSNGETIHGPCLATYTNVLDHDRAPCIKCSFWPHIASEWINRTRVHGWPAQEMINEIVANGCHVVPVGDSSSQDSRFYNHEWRMSFSCAERYLMHSLNHTQFLVYCLLRLALKKNIENCIPNALCSYFMKTILFYTIENTEEAIWQGERLEECYQQCLFALFNAVCSQNCPNYFVLKNNMFRNKVNQSNVINLKKAIGNLRNNGVFRLLVDHEWMFVRRSLTYSNYIEMALDVDSSIPYYSRISSRFYLYFCHAYSKTNLRMESPIGRIKNMILENKVFKDNDIQDYLITISVRDYCQMLMNKLSDLPNESDTNNLICQQIESLLRNVRQGDITTVPLTTATYMYLTGNAVLAMHVLQQLISECPSYMVYDAISADSMEEYMKAMCGKGRTIGYKYRRSLTPLYDFCMDWVKAAPFPLRLWIVMLQRQFFPIDPQTYAFFLLNLCEVNGNECLGIRHLNEKLTKSKDPYRIAEIKMCLGIIASTNNRRQEAFEWFYSVCCMSNQLKDTKGYQYVPVIYILCLVSDCKNRNRRRNSIP